MKKYFCLIIINLFFFNVYSQTEIDNEKEKYSIIKSIFKGKINNLFLYEKFENFKGMTFFLDNPKVLKDMYGQPSDLDEISKSLKDVDFSDEFSKITNETFLNTSMLDPGIKLIKSKSIDDNAKVTYISEPIIIKDLGFIYLKSNYEESIMILKKKESNWEVICHKYTFLMLVN
ncbi:hypothetical protein SAMN04487906_0008 [Zhouia amylolytica]|uniref:Uncharacterized protein n=1 Tax=Zhouia amylolytica TaxID=376730 RepID=A0A1I6NXW5_9FLAO|nr:hypothetical protein [Zhouia amylolytica]SFS32796.1 hypothetical protein SAMN04487906_0008 [Zhouia amylolytica]